MKIAFVGVKRKYRELPVEYIESFDRYHLELPWYFARAGMHVTLTTIDMSEGPVGPLPVGSGSLHHRYEVDRWKEEQYDAVIHWRKFYPELAHPSALNFVLCQDHSFSEEWKRTIRQATDDMLLQGILCFPGWHKMNIFTEFNGLYSVDRLYDGVTLGVDTEIYRPSEDKDPYQMLWASDPGRGLDRAISLAQHLFRMYDKRYRLHICHPDYVQNPWQYKSPPFTWHGFVPNGPRLWDLFNRTGVLPYTSTFKEPSSRAHRQAMAAGSLVLYPPGMGTPSDLIEHRRTGLVEDTVIWAEHIHELVTSGGWKKIGENARKLAESENWDVQARRFNELIARLSA